MNIFESRSKLPPSTYLWLLHGNFDLGRHQSTFDSRFNNLFLCIREFVSNVNKAFYGLVSRTLNNSIKRLIINLGLNRSILHNRALKTDFSQTGTKIIKIVQLEEVLEISKVTKS